MPDRAPHPCYHAGCKNLTHTRFCVECAKTHDAWGWTKSASERGYGYAWEKLRVKVLRRDPVCRMCGIRESNNVDHIKPKTAGGKDDLSNLQGLCTQCHREKTQQDRKNA